MLWGFWKEDDLVGSCFAAITGATDTDIAAAGLFNGVEVVGAFGFAFGIAVSLLTRTDAGTCN